MGNTDRAAVVVTFTSKTGGPGLVLVADTNVNSGISNADLFAKLGQNVGADTPTESTTCCYGNWVDDFTFDRIITTLQGTGAVSVGDVVAHPGAEQHKPVTIAISFPA